MHIPPANDLTQDLSTSNSLAEPKAMTKGEREDLQPGAPAPLRHAGRGDAKMREADVGEGEHAMSVVASRNSRKRNPSMLR
jgi:hypothetical protein